jgi:hypothetical protein
MTREDVERLACDFVAAHRLEVAGLVSVSYVTLPIVDEASIPPDTLGTYLSVKSRFRNHWVVRFRKIIPPGVTECPETEMLSVYEDGEITHSTSI